MADPARAIADNPYAPPTRQGPESHAAQEGTARRDGPLLVVGNASALPPLCVKCGASEPPRSRKATFSYAPPWARLFGPIVLLLIEKHSTFTFPMCKRCHLAWRRSDIALAVAFIVPCLVLVGVGTAVGALGARQTGTMTSFLALPVGIAAVALVRWMRRSYVVVATKVDKHETWLRGVHETVMRAAIYRS